MFKMPKELIVFDVESTGIDVDVSSIIQLGAVIIDKEGKIKDTTFNIYIKPYTSEWTEQAFNVHKITRGFLKENGYTIIQALEEFEKWAITNAGKTSNPKRSQKRLINDYYLAQWSAGWDVRMLQKAYQQTGRKYPFHYRSFDLASIVRFELAKRGELHKKCGTLICAKRLGLPTNKEQQHDALYDAKFSAELFVHLVKEANENESQKSNK